MNKRILLFPLIMMLSVVWLNTALANDDSMIWKYKEHNQDSLLVSRNHYNRGLYLEINGKYTDLPCLAVAGTKNNHWQVLKKDLTRASYTPDQVL